MHQTRPLRIDRTHNALDKEKIENDVLLRIFSHRNNTFGCCNLVFWTITNINIVQIYHTLEAIAHIKSSQTYMLTTHTLHTANGWSVTQLEKSSLQLHFIQNKRSLLNYSTRCHRTRSLRIIHIHSDIPPHDLARISIQCSMKSNDFITFTYRIYTSNSEKSGN